MSNSKIDKISEIIPQFYFDLIARVAPGALILLMYGIYLNNVIKFPDLGKTLIFFICLLCSYFIGLVLDVAIGVLACAVSGIGYVIIDKNKNLSAEKIKWWNDKTIWLEINKLEDVARASILTKIMTEKTLFRTMFVVSLLTLYMPQQWIWPYMCQYSLLIRSIITVIIFICFIRFEFYVRQRLRAAKQNDR